MKLGDIIDDVIDVLDKSSFSYMDYCKLKAQLLEGRIQAQYIETEIDRELKLDNDEKIIINYKKIGVENIHTYFKTF